MRPKKQDFNPLHLQFCIYSQALKPGMELPTAAITANTVHPTAFGQQTEYFPGLTNRMTRSSSCAQIINFKYRSP